jgi:hypothetical protein
MEKTASFQVGESRIVFEDLKTDAQQGFPTISAYATVPTVACEATVLGTTHCLVICGGDSVFGRRAARAARAVTMLRQEKTAKHCGDSW